MAHLWDWLHPHIRRIWYWYLWMSFYTLTILVYLSPTIPTEAPPKVVAAYYVEQAFGWPWYFLSALGDIFGSLIIIVSQL